MTASVVSLASHRQRAETTRTCRACQASRGALCYPHRLEVLAGRLAAALTDTAGELLVDRERFEAAITDALTITRGITRECLPPENETNTR